MNHAGGARDCRSIPICIYVCVVVYDDFFLESANQRPALVFRKGYIITNESRKLFKKQNELFPLHGAHIY